MNPLDRFATNFDLIGELGRTTEMFLAWLKNSKLTMLIFKKIKRMVELAHLM